MKFKLTFVGVVFMLLHVWSNLALAQSLDSIMHGGELDQVVVTAQYRPTDTRASVNSVKIIGQKILTSRAAVNLQELLQTESNIRVVTDPILGSQLSINGLKGENLKIMIDGVPIIGRLNGNIDAGQIPLQSIQKIEIIEGAQSLMYGSEASGGVINIITKKGQLGKYNLNSDVYLENNGFKTASASIGTQIKKWNASLMGQWQQFRPLPIDSVGRDQLWNDKDQVSGRGMVRFQPNASDKWTMTSSLLSEKIYNPGAVRRPQYKPYAFDDTYKTEKFDANLQHEHWWNDKIVWQSTAGYNTFNRIKVSGRYDFETSQFTLLDGEQDTSLNHAILIRSTLANDDEKQFINWQMGAEYYYENATGTRLLDSTISKNGYAYNTDLSAFGSLKFVKPRWTAQVGARYTHNKLYGSAVNPSLWFLHRVHKRLQWRSSIASGYRTPSIKELYFDFIDINHQVTGNQNLKPERSVNIKTELQWDVLKNNQTALKFSSGGFYNDVKDRISLTALGPVHYEYRNVENWKTMGVTAKLQFELENLGYLTLDGIYTSYYNTFSSSDANLPSSIWSFDFTSDVTFYLKKDKLHWNSWLKRTGKTPFYISQGDAISEEITPAWTMLNSSISTFFLKKKLILQIGCKNILDVRQFVANLGNGIHVEQANQQALHWGRTGFLQLKWSLDTK